MVEVEQDGKRLLLRSEVQGTCGAVLRAAGVAVPPTVQQATLDPAAPEPILVPRRACRFVNACTAIGCGRILSKTSLRDFAAVPGFWPISTHGPILAEPPDLHAAHSGSGSSHGRSP